MPMIDPPGLLTLAAARLLGQPPLPGDPACSPRGDHDGQDEPVPLPDETAARPASVLVPIVMRTEGPTVLLTRRNANLRAHPGQIAFPGGRVDPSDASIVDAARREAFEEIGLEPALVSPLGFLDPYLSSSGFRIVPVVASVAPGFTLALNPAEVDEVFETPLSFLMDPANHQRHSRPWQGRLRHYYAIPHGDRYIWGVTAGIIRNLYERLYG